MNLYFILLVFALFNNKPYSKKHVAKPDLVIKASEFRLDDVTKKIFFKAEISNIGDAPCNINGSYAIDTYLSEDGNIGNDLPSGGRIIQESFTLQPGVSKILADEYFISYNTFVILRANPYCVIFIKPAFIDIESTEANNKSIYKHGFPRKKGEGLSNQPNNVPAQQAIRNIDLKLTVSNVSSTIITDPETGKQFREYNYTANIKNIGNYDAVIDLDKPISLQHWSVPSCSDTTNKSSASRPINQNTAYTLKPGKTLLLTNRKATQSPDAVTSLLAELIYAGKETNLTNNITCISN